VALEDSGNRNLHRIGGASIENLRLKPHEAVLNPPGISVLKATTPAEAAKQMRTAYPNATGLHEAAKTVASTTEALIRSVGFDVISNPSRRLAAHHEIVHPDGAAGFCDDNLARLAAVFVTTEGH
jgi:hypothetical protein